MKKIFLGLALLISGFQCQASASIDSECLEKIVVAGQICILGCESARYMIRSLHSATIPSDVDQIQSPLILNCCNPYTICAVGCCLKASTEPELVCAGISCSIIGCCYDYGLYHRTLFCDDKDDHNKIN